MERKRVFAAIAAVVIAVSVVGFVLLALVNPVAEAIAKVFVLLVMVGAIAVMVYGWIVDYMERR